MHILGISAFYHDSAAALVTDGVVVGAVQEERFTRKKHDPSFPRQAIASVLSEVGRKLSEVDFVVFYDKPFIKFERLLETYLAVAPRGFRSFAMAIPLWLKEKLFQKNMLKNALREFDPNFDVERRLLFTEHHLAHAASAFFPSPFSDAVILTMDGVGEWATTTIGRGQDHRIQIEKEIHFPHSLGLLYSAFTYYTGFKVNSGEYKVMGLAPYGEPVYAQTILDHLIDLKPDGSFRLNLDYFNYCAGLTMTNDRFDRLFGAPPKQPDEPLDQRHMNLAASIQAVTEEVVLRLTRAAAKEYPNRPLCLAGGVALNCVANGKILRDGHFPDVWIQPAAGDAGGALGAALAAYHMHAGKPRQIASEKNGVRDGMSGSYLGPSFEQSDIEQRMRAAGARYSVCDEPALLVRTANALASNQAVGWFQGRMEFGPRALGNRSILADPRSPDMQKNLNLKVKYRESFRPFAPAVRREDVADWFELDVDSPYMLLVADIAKTRRRTMSEAENALFGIDKLNVPRSDIPAVTHIDYSARIQTVHRDTNARFHALLSAFQEQTGCPILVNTSFNVRGEPIVLTPEDAFRCFMGSGLDVLVCGNCFLEKMEQDPTLVVSYKDAFELD
jgi:carbamoyltransferase